MSNTQKALFALVLAATSGLSLAQSSAPSSSATDPAAFAAYKQKTLTRIANHIQVAQTLQSCVQGANDSAAMKSCKKAAHGSMGHRHG
jgi:hypothetical protein